MATSVPPNDLPPWAVGNYGAGAFSWSSTARRVATGITAFAAAALTPNQKTDAQSFNEWLARIQEWIEHQRSFSMLGLYGDAFDGDVVIGAGTSLTRDSYYNNLTISSGFLLNTAGYRVFVRGTLLIEAGATLSHRGANASGATAGSGAPSGSLLGGTAGGAGAVAPPGAAGTAGTNHTNALGSGGGAGGTVTSFAGGAGGTATAPAASAGGTRDLRAANGVLLGGTQFRGGAGGGGGAVEDGNGAAGGGGGGGGNVVIFARVVDNQGTISAMGGNGGNATAGTSTEVAGGGGGGGGTIFVVHREAVGGTLGTVTAAGGAAGTGAGALAQPPGIAGTDGRVVLLEA